MTVKAAYHASQRHGTLMTSSMVKCGTGEEGPGSCCSSVPLPWITAEFQVIAGTQEEPLIAGLEPKFLAVPLGVRLASSVFSVLSC